MKLVINYDFFKAVQNVNEPLTPLKIVRNEPKYCWFTIFEIPYAYHLGLNIPQTFMVMLPCYGIYMTVDLAFEYIYKKQNISNMDSYAHRGRQKLMELPSKLDVINVKTNYDMLLSSELYEKKYKFESGEEGIIPLKEEKYIYVPSYGFDGKEKETSILQEHYFGTGNYLLSVGEPEKKYKRVLIKNPI